MGDGAFDGGSYIGQVLVALIWARESCPLGFFSPECRPVPRDFSDHEVVVHLLIQYSGLEAVLWTFDEGISFEEDVSWR